MKNPETNWTQRAGREGRDTLDMLDRLRRANRLAYHVMEEEDLFAVHHERGLERMKMPCRGGIQAALETGAPSLNSLSLLPPAESHVVLQPYGLRSMNGMNRYGYLFDLSQDQPDPARIITAYRGGLMSGENNKQKRIDGPNKRNPLYAPYYPHHLSNDAARNREFRENMVAAVAGHEGTRLSEAQLDQMAASYLDMFPPAQGKKISGEFNEVIACVSPAQIRAIVLPLNRPLASVTMPEKYNPMPRTLYDARVRLQAAIIGLDHLRTGKDVPVVLYHCNGPKAGQFDYVGRGTEELQRIGLQALQELGPEGIKRTYEMTSQHTVHGAPGDDFRELTYGAKQYLGVNIELASVLRGKPQSWPAEISDRLNTNYR